MRPDLHHAEHCRCGNCAPPMTRAETIFCGVCVFLIPVIGLGSEPILAAIRSILP